jgi:hypothetical protein
MFVGQKLEFYDGMITIKHGHKYLNNMKTAVEWLFEQYVNKSIITIKDIEQAKEMEKEQMKDSYKQGFAYRDTWNWELDVDWDKDSTQENNQEFEQYYNKTFKSE